MCEDDKNIELVQVRTIPVPSATLYQEALANGTFIGTFDQFLVKMRGNDGDVYVPQFTSDYFGN